MRSDSAYAWAAVSSAFSPRARCSSAFSRSNWAVLGAPARCRRSRETSLAEAKLPSSISRRASSIIGDAFVGVPHVPVPIDRRSKRGTGIVHPSEVLGDATL